MMPTGGDGAQDSPANELSESLDGFVADPLKMAELRPQIHRRARAPSTTPRSR